MIDPNLPILMLLGVIGVVVVASTTDSALRQLAWFECCQRHSSDAISVSLLGTKPRGNFVVQS
jgi:hypothetical protein